MDINGEVNLFLFLTKMELWPKNFTDDNKFEIEFAEIQDKFNSKTEIKVKQAVKLYRILMPDENLNEEDNSEKINVKKTKEDNKKKENTEEGIKILCRKPKKAPRY